MRIVAGKYRGKNLTSPLDDRVRPTTTRIKETLFNILQADVIGAVVLDLFAGSGALGIECVSRGAAEVIFADNSRDSIALTKQNLKGIQGNYSVVSGDFSVVLDRMRAINKKFDIIFLDPPYASDMGERAIKKIVELDLLLPGGVIVFEHGYEKAYAMSHEGYAQRTKLMGTVTAEFIRKKRVALMTGSFDPVTKGHEAVLKAALDLYDEVVVACLVNPDKTYAFTPAQRLALAEAMCAQFKGARAIFSSKTVVETAAEVGATELVRGVRNAADEGYEREMAEYNRQRGYDTKFIAADGFEDVSSTLVRSQLQRGDLSNVPSACVPLLSSPEFKLSHPQNL